MKQVLAKFGKWWKANNDGLVWRGLLFSKNDVAKAAYIAGYQAGAKELLRIARQVDQGRAKRARAALKAGG